MNPKNMGVRPCPSTPQSYKFVQRDCTKPQFLPLESGANAYLTVPSGGPSIQ